MINAAPFLMISRHDYRSRRRVNVHFIARELARVGKTRFFSSSFSLFAWVKRDQRLPLRHRTNRVENFEGVDAFLWETFFHPFKIPALLQPIMDICFKAYVRNAPDTLRQWIAESRTIFLESGGSEIYFDLIKQINPRAKVYYICSDALGPIGCSAYICRQLARIAPLFDAIYVPSKLLAKEFSSDCKVFYVPHGLDSELFETLAPSPYRSGVNIVSVGNMLFDPTFFKIASAAFPNVNFHIIGGGKKAKNLHAPNIVIYDEMPFKDTLSYIKYAQAGVAPYDEQKGAPYLADTSMKLMQYEGFGLPALCPTMMVGNHKYRFGYTLNDPESVTRAVSTALACGRFKGPSMLSWDEVTKRLLSPEGYPDTDLN